MTSVLQCEIDKNCLKILDRHWPGVPKCPDIKSLRGKPGVVDLICGGFPCQDLSIAGRQKGLAGERSGLFFEIARVIEEAKPEWVVLENVPGLLSSKSGRDMGVVIGTLDDLGYLGAWRVLDGQYFALAQRRQRVFIVGRLGTLGAQKVLFERKGLCGNSPPSREAREGDTLRIAGGARVRGFGLNGDPECGGPFLSSTKSLRTTDLDGVSAYVVHYADSIVSQAISCKWAKGTSGPAGDEHHNLVAYRKKARAGSGSESWEEGAFANTLDAGGNVTRTAHAVVDSLNLSVRRLTPTECERLQGFPDGWTGDQSDSARYKQIGNAVAVPVVEWIGRRIMAVSRGEL